MRSWSPSKRIALACPSIEATSIGWMERRHVHREKMRPPGRIILATAVQERQNEARQRNVSTRIGHDGSAVGYPKVGIADAYKHPKFCGLTVLLLFLFICAFTSDAKN